MAIDTIIINSAEIILKRGNRRMFERQLMDNVRAALADWRDYRLEQRQASLFLRFGSEIAENQEKAAIARLSRVFGIAQLILSKSCPAEIGSIVGLALEMLGDIETGSFKVAARRSDKSFHLTSPEIGRQVGAAVLKRKPKLTVSLGNPQTTIAVLVDRERAYVGIDPQSGPGGLPVGASGHLVSLLSGGIDSPVAAWKMASRGCRLTFVHFHSYPFVGTESMEKVKRLGKILAGWQAGAQLHLLPFAEIQKTIVAKGRAANRVLLYRRAMLRLAERVAVRTGALGLVTGDSVGQVASQTLENIQAVSAAVSLPIYRPLCGDDKETIVRTAKRLGSYRLSIQPHDDCCSLFVPDHPATRASAAVLEADESDCGLDELLNSTLAQAEIVDLSPDFPAESAIAS